MGNCTNVKILLNLFGQRSQSYTSSHLIFECIVESRVGCGGIETNTNINNDTAMVELMVDTHMRNDEIFFNIE